MGSLGSQHTQLGHVQLSPTSTPSPLPRAAMDDTVLRKILWPPGVLRPLKERSAALLPESPWRWMWQCRLSYTWGQLFPLDLCCGWGQSTDPSVLFRVVQYYSVWLNDYPLLCHQRIFMTIEGRLSSWRRDNAWLSAARQRVPFRGHSNVFSYSHGHHNFSGLGRRWWNTDEGKKWPQRTWIHGGIFTLWGFFFLNFNEWLIGNFFGFEVFFFLFHTRNCFGLFCLSLFIMQPK